MMIKNGFRNVGISWVGNATEEQNDSSEDEYDDDKENDEDNAYMLTFCAFLIVIGKKKTLMDFSLFLTLLCHNI